MQINGFTSKASAIRALRETHPTFNSGLARPESNPKVAKNGKLGIMTAPLHLAPARLSGYNTCPMASAGCIAACLHTAGNPVYMDTKQKSRITKTRAYMENRAAFMAVIGFEIIALARKAHTADMTPGVRLNATSDIPFERVAIEINGKTYASVMDYFTNVEFYDYTAIPKRAIAFGRGKMPANYHITFSRKENNDAACKSVLASGGNVAIVFAAKTLDGQSVMAKRAGFDAPLVNADEHDFRPVDGKGVIAALYAKGDAKSDTSGFVLR